MKVNLSFGKEVGACIRAGSFIRINVVFMLFCVRYSTAITIQRFLKVYEIYSFRKDKSK